MLVQYTDASLRAGRCIICGIEAPGAGTSYCDECARYVSAMRSDKAEPPRNYWQNRRADVANLLARLVTREQAELGDARRIWNCERLLRFCEAQIEQEATQ
jgi:hypothetical protein